MPDIASASRLAGGENPGAGADHYAAVTALVPRRAPAPHLRWVIASLAALFTCVACSGNPLGKTCTAAAQCGSGFDCYRNVCVHVCTSDAQCRDGQVCQRYRCLMPNGDPPVKLEAQTREEHPPASAPPQSTTTTPPVPDATAAELRAIRREIEMLRREQQRLADEVQRLQTDGKRP